MPLPPDAFVIREADRLPLDAQPNLLADFDV
jgi:hypothetical protein